MVVHSLVAFLNELLKESDLLVRHGVFGVFWHHVRREDQHYLAVGHLLVVKGVHLGKKLLDIGLVIVDVHHGEEGFELALADDPILVVVYRLEKIRELHQEALVLLQLKIQYYLAEVLVEELRALL